MTILVVILLVFALLIMAGGLGLWFVFRQRQAPRKEEPVKLKKETPPATTPGFRWSYIVLPLAILLLSMILAAYFYRLLPAQVGYHFRADGAADRFLGRGTLLLAMVGPQFFFTLVAGGIALVASKMGVILRSKQPTASNAGGIISLMSNMVTLPQIVLCFAMADIFSYNAYQIHLLPLWVFALIVMLGGAIVLGIFFIRAIQTFRGRTSK